MVWEWTIPVADADNYDRNPVTNFKGIKQVMNGQEKIIQEVGTVYRWLDEQLAGMDSSCRACGHCCDFESFGHRLYVTTPELLYFQHHLGKPVKAMTTGVCPYHIDGKCTVYPCRFSGCRIFLCKGDTEKENALCEQAIRKFKALCDQYSIPYHYVYLQIGLEMLSENPGFNIKS
jgi:hypothetical protein